VGATSPTLITPALGTPSSGTLTSCTGLPIAGTTGYGTGVATALAANVIGGGGIGLSTATLSFTPVVSYATPGDLSVSYAVQEGSYVRVGNIVQYNFEVTFTPTFTTSLGALTITLPLNANTSFANAFGAVSMSNVTLSALNTQVIAITNSTTFNLYQSGSTTGRSMLGAAQLTSGTSYSFYGSIIYTI